MPLAGQATFRHGGEPCKVSPVQVEKIARVVARFLKIRKPFKVFVKNAARGHASGKNTSITLPHFLLHKEKSYIVYYIVHEVSHLYPGTVGHKSSFKRVERRGLKKFGMGIRYMHAYPASLFALTTGKVLYGVRRVGDWIEVCVDCGGEIKLEQPPIEPLRGAMVCGTCVQKTIGSFALKQFMAVYSR